MAASAAALRFGLVGRFEGDDAKLAAARAVADHILAGDAVPPSDVADALSLMPFSGRVEFVVKVCMLSPQRDATVRSLYDWCFTSSDTEDLSAHSGSEDDDFVMIGCGATLSMNCSRYFVLKALMTVIPLCGELGVELFRRYDKSTSTVFRSQFMAAMVKNAAFSNEELLAACEKSVDAERSQILAAARQLKHRAPFIELAVAAGIAPQPFLFYASSATLAAQLATPAYAQITRDGFVNFTPHREVLIARLKADLATMTIQTITT